MGGRRGYGPTHSQSLEKLFLGVPGLRVLAPCALSAGPEDGPGALLANAILTSEDPVLFVENKLLYLLPVLGQEQMGEFEITVIAGEKGIGSRGAEAASTISPTPYPLSPILSPLYSLRLRGAPPPSVTLAAYGHMAELARQAMLRLAYEYEIFAELWVPTQLAPFALEPIIESAGRTRRLVVLEEGTLSLGWGAEVLAQAAEAIGPRLQRAQRLAARDLPIPSSGPLEAAVLPGIEEILQTVRMVV
jgi:pyruvate/2-oxoglutarate/acetoin dehydrogenase E1 component